MKYIYHIYRLKILIIKGTKRFDKGKYISNF